MFELFAFDYMVKALIAALLAGLVCAVIGVLVVYRRLAFVGHALAHASMPGLVLATLAGIGLFWGALIVDLLAAAGIALLARRRSLHEDTAIGVVSTGVFAIGVVVIAAQRSFRDYEGLLFGSALTVGNGDLVGMAVCSVLVLGTLLALRKEFVLSSYDPGYAGIIGYSPELLRVVLLVLLALTVVATVQLVGAILTAALLVVPAATGSLLFRRLGAVVVTAVIVAEIAAVVGIYLTWFFSGLPPGPAIVLVSTALFVPAFVINWVRQRRLQTA